MVRYIRQTIHLPLIIGGKKHNRGWYIDASFAVHQDMKSHTGSFFTLGRGSVYSRLAKQKLNTNSSTAAEIVARGDTLPQIVWMRNFAKHQGNLAPKEADNVFQDNEAAIRIGTNGRSSSKRGTRHLDIRYFYISDRVEKGDVKIIYCPTKEMIADYFTKPLQGEVFIKFRNLILGIRTDDDKLYLDDYHDILEHFALAD